MESTTKKPRVFVMTPFTEECLAVFEDLRESFKDKYELFTAGDMDNQQSIIKDIVHGILEADVVIADLSGLNPNVFYELGLAHALNKKAIIITQDIGELPFDIKPYRANEYSLQFNKYPLLKTELEKLLDGAISNEIEYGNPVSDYAEGSVCSSCNLPIQAEDSNQNDGYEENDEDLGFLDRISIIEEKSVLMTKEIEIIESDLEKMNKDVVKTSSEVNRVSKTGGSGNASFIRNLCKKLANPIAIFGDNLVDHVKIIAECWGAIENNYLALLNNKWMGTDENQKGLEESLIALANMRRTIGITNGQVDELKDSMGSALGIERKLTQAIKKAVNALDEYTTCTEVMASSIERIEAKSVIILTR